VWFVLAILTGQALSPTPLRLYSIGGTVVTFVLLAYERYIWRWKPVRWLTGAPLLAGTWRGTLISSYVRPDGSKVDPIPTVIRITQTASTLTVTLFTGESSSVSKAAELKRLSDGRWSLNWLYENTPRPSVRHRSERHCGAAEMSLGGRDGEELAGEYFTDRMTRGELHFGEWSPRQYGSAEAALQATDFIPATPFAKKT
jgi:SMODS-associating 2TM, beta-strand rich effector domain